MPFYEYQCGSCSHHVEVLQKISDAPLRKCPDCGKQALKRLMSAPVFRLKGAGWYETDFKSESEQKRNLAGPEEGAEAKADDTKTDSAETAKSDAKPGESKTEAAKPDSAAVKKTSVAKPVARTKPPARPSAKPKPTKRVAKAAARKKAAARR